MNNAGYTFIFLAVVCSLIHGQWIKEKIVHGLIDKNDDYWVVKVHGRVNKPLFRTYIRFYNKHTAKSEFDIECSRSHLIYYNEPYSEIIFRTTGHLWTEGDSYFITLDEGVLYSNAIENSTEYLNPKFWKFDVVRPRDTQ